MLLSFLVAISRTSTYWRTGFHHGFHFAGFHSHFYIIHKCLNIQHLNLIALKLYLHVAALYKWADCAFQKVRNEQALHEKASGKWQVVSWASPGPPSHSGRRELLPPVPSFYQLRWLGWPQFCLCGSRIALIIEAQDSCEGGMRRLDCRPRKLLRFI